MHAIAWVYILTNPRRTVFYVGSTIDLWTRLWEHRTKRNPKSFTAKYNVTMLVYYEGYEDVDEARAREKYIKQKSRSWKIDLIASMNPAWRDLTDDVKTDGH